MSRKRNKQKKVKVYKTVKVTTAEKTITALRSIKDAARDELLLQAFVKLKENTFESRKEAIDLYCVSKAYKTVPVNALSELLTAYRTYNSNTITV